MKCRTESDWLCIVDQIFLTRNQIAKSKVEFSRFDTDWNFNREVIYPKSSLHVMQTRSPGTGAGETNNIQSCLIYINYLRGVVYRYSV